MVTWVLIYHYKICIHSQHQILIRTNSTIIEFDRVRAHSFFTNCLDSKHRFCRIYFNLCFFYILLKLLLYLYYCGSFNFWLLLYYSKWSSNWLRRLWRQKPNQKNWIFFNTNVDNFNFAGRFFINGRHVCGLATFY